MSSIATTNETSNVTSLPTPPNLCWVRERLLSLTVWLSLTRIHFRLPSMRELVDTVSACEVSNTTVSPACVPPLPWPR